MSSPASLATYAEYFLLTDARVVLL